MFKVLVDAGKPLSVAQIHVRLHRNRINLVSVYRTIRLFVDLGILRTVDASAGSQRFELVEPYNNHHHHLICTRCGEIVELEGCLLTDEALHMISHQVRRDTRFEVTGHEVQLLGRCGNCSTASRNTVQSHRGRRGGRLTAALVILAIGFLLLAPDPHDHGDAGSLGGLLRLFLSGTGQTHGDPHHHADESQPEMNGSCPIHFWHQIAATGLLVVCLLQFFLGTLHNILLRATTPYVTELGSSQSRAPPAYP